MDYKSYNFTILEKLKLIACSVLGTGLISYLFYDTLWGIALSPVVLMVCRKYYREYLINKRYEQLTIEFLDALRCIGNSMMAGASMENAWIEAQGELVLLYGEDSIMAMELAEMNRKERMSIPLEKSLEDFAQRVDSEEVVSFSEIFIYAKRNGGSLVDIIENTGNKIRQKHETLREIEVAVASKRLENRVMSIVPLFILCYLRFTNPGYLDSLYDSALGMIFMTVCLLVYGLAIILGRKIMDIQV